MNLKDRAAQSPPRLSTFRNRSVLSLAIFVALVVVFTYLSTAEKWSLQINDYTKSKQSLQRNATVTLPNMNRNIILIEGDLIAADTVLKYMLNQGCQTMRNKKKRYSCLDKLPASTLSDNVKNYMFLFHPRGGATLAANSFLFVLRHPIDRTASWFAYSHRSSCGHDGGTTMSMSCGAARDADRNPEGWQAVFEKCFPVIQDLAGAVSVGNLAEPHCRSLAWSLFGTARIESGIGIHMSANYRYYYNKTVAAHPDKEVIVARTENFAQDMNDIERLLLGNGDFSGEFDDEVKNSFLEPQNLTDAVAKTLCCALQDDLVVYKAVLVRAQNWNAWQKMGIWSEIMRRCGVDSHASLEQECKLVLAPKPLY